MLTIILYAYMNIYSCRKIEKAVHRYIHYTWLTPQERPDYVTLNSFRNKVKSETNNIFTQTTLRPAESGLITLDVEYIDGTKMESQTDKCTFVWRKSVEKNLASYRKRYALRPDRSMKSSRSTRPLKPQP